MPLPSWTLGIRVLTRHMRENVVIEVCGFIIADITVDLIITSNLHISFTWLFIAVFCIISLTPILTVSGSYSINHVYSLSLLIVHVCTLLSIIVLPAILLFRCISYNFLSS